MHSLTDIGANLAHDSFDADLDEVLARAAEAGVGTILVTGSCADSARAAAAMHGRRENVQLWATAGLHPHHASQFTPQLLDEFRALAALPGVVAIGETGLDYFRNFSPREDQQRAFAAHIELAAELKMPMFLHQRDAHGDFLKLLRPHLARLPGAVVHCFTGSAAELDDYLALDLYVGITGWICDERRGQHLQECVHKIPAERLLIETDAPYLLPRSLRPRPSTRRNEPMWLPEVAATIARCRGVEVAELARQTQANAARLFGLPSQEFSAP